MRFAMRFVRTKPAFLHKIAEFPISPNALSIIVLNFENKSKSISHRVTTKTFFSQQFGVSSFKL